MTIRDESPADIPAIHDLTTAAFAGAPHSSGTEAAIVDALRRAGALTLSLVAEAGGVVVGHAAFSPVTIDGGGAGWFGLGPVSVLPAHQGRGIGGALVRAGLDRLRQAGAQGFVVLGEPAYYGRFGFRADPALRLPGLPAEYFQCLACARPLPNGEVAYHPGFAATS